MTYTKAIPVGVKRKGQIEKYIDIQGGTKLESALVVKEAFMNKTK